MHAPALLAALALAAPTTPAPTATSPSPAASHEIRTAEGFLRVEGGAFVPGAGSIASYRPSAPGLPPDVAPSAEGGAGAPPDERPRAGGGGAPAQPRLDACRGERTRYVRRLLQLAGIDLPDPASFLEGLAGRGAYQGAYLFTAYGLLPGLDPIRPLAWDFELRSLANDLSACVSGDTTRPR